jgi:hypothetical protein
VTSVVCKGPVRMSSPFCWQIRTDVGEFSFVGRTIADWNRLSQRATGTSLVKTHVFRKRLGKSISEVKWRSGELSRYSNELQAS